MSDDEPVIPIVATESPLSIDRARKTLVNLKHELSLVPKRTPSQKEYRKVLKAQIKVYKKSIKTFEDAQTDG